MPFVVVVAAGLVGALFDFDTVVVGPAVASSSRDLKIFLPH